MTNFDHISLGTEEESILESLNSAILFDTTLPRVDKDTVVGVVRTGDVQYVVQENDPKTFTGYKLKRAGMTDSYYLADAERGTPYVVLKTIMSRVFNDPTASQQITDMMHNAYSPLDILITQKGVTDQELIPTIEKLNGYELQELYDFVQGMKTVLDLKKTETPKGATLIYPDKVNILDTPYESDEAEAIFDYSEALIPEYGTDEQDDDVFEAEIGVTYDQNNAETEFEKPQTQELQESEKKANGIATRLLSLFKRDKK